MIETQPAALVFRVEAPGVWGNLLQLRVHNHFRMFGLAELYAAQAAEELLNVRHQLAELYAAAGAVGVRAQLQDRAVSCARARRNGWRTSAYARQRMVLQRRIRIPWLTAIYGGR